MAYEILQHSKILLHFCIFCSRLETHRAQINEGHSTGQTQLAGTMFGLIAFLLK